MNSATRRTIGVISIAFLLGSCSTAPAVTTTTALPPANLVVTMSEWRFAPADGAVSAGQPAVIELRNAGTLLHEWTLVSGHVETEEDLDDVEVLANQQVNAGGVERIVIPVLEPGVYEVVCPIPGHIASGMVGTLTVEG